jgi:hypothetical protein
MTSRSNAGRRCAGIVLAMALAGCGGRGCGGGGAATRGATGTAPAPVASARPAASARRAHARPIVVVPRSGAPITTDGKNDEAAWLGSGRTGPFFDASGAIARPYSDARLLWDDERLYLTLYAADNDIRAPHKERDAALEEGDAFTVRLALPGEGDAGPGQVVLLAFAPNGAVYDARELPGGGRDVAFDAHASVGLDADGTPNDPSDEDEEWIVEAAIPWSALGVKPAAGMRIGARFGRCDVPKDTTERRCSAWGDAPAGELVLGPDAATPPPTPSAAPPGKPKRPRP